MPTALEIGQATALELGLPSPSALFGSSADATGRQLGALLNRVGKELAAEFDWTDLQREYIIEIEAPTVTVGNISTGSRLISGIPSVAGLTSDYTVSGQGLAQSSRVVSASDATSITINQQAIETASGVELTFVRDAFDLPADFDRYMGETWWDRTSSWQLIGPVSAAAEAFQRSGILESGTRRRWRQRGGKWRIWPPPVASDVPDILVFDYISSSWANSSGGDDLSALTADDDEPLFPEHVLTLGLKAALWRAKGFDWVSLYNEFFAAARRAAGQDGGARTITMGGRPLAALTEPSVADGSWDIDD